MTARAQVIGMAMASFLVVAGCSGGGLGGSGGASGTSGAISDKTPVLDGKLSLAAPGGFCPDPSASRSDDTSAFVLYGSCRAINGRGPEPAAPAILTAAVSGEQALEGQDFGALTSYLETSEGRRALSRSGDSAEVSVKSIEQASNLILVEASDGGAREMAPDFWRAIFAQSGTLVTVTVSSLASAPLPPETAKSVTTDFIAAIQAANATTPPDATAATTKPDTSDALDPTTVGTKPGALRAFFQRLL